MKYSAPSDSRFPRALRSSVLVLGTALAASFLAGCGRTTHVSHGGGPPTSSPLSFVELEPNDSPAFPDFVAVLDAFSWVTVDGHVEAVGFDIVDHIEFEASEPIEIDFTLRGFGPFADLDVSIYDPIDNVVLGTYAIGGPIESGTIIVHDPGRPFQFVIEAFDTDSPWQLELEAFPHVCSCYASLGGGSGGDTLDGEAADGEALRRDLPGRGTNLETGSSPDVKPAPIELKRLPGEVRSREEQLSSRDF